MKGIVTIYFVVGMLTFGAVKNACEPDSTPLMFSEKMILIGANVLLACLLTVLFVGGMKKKKAGHVGFWSPFSSFMGGLVGYLSGFAIVQIAIWVM
jgi:hypothetical protein